MILKSSQDRDGGPALGNVPAVVGPYNGCRAEFIDASRFRCEARPLVSILEASGAGGSPTFKRMSVRKSAMHALWCLRTMCMEVAP